MRSKLTAFNEITNAELCPTFRILLPTDAAMARARARRRVLLVLSILLADPAACTPFVAARAQPAERRKVGLVAAHALGQHTPLTPSIPALIVATLFETMLHRAVCSNPCGTGSVLMMTPASAAIDDAGEEGATRPADVSMGRLVVQMAQSYFRGLATLVRLLLRQPDVPQALILLTVLGYAAQLVIGPSLARSGARLTSQVRSSLGCLPSPSPPLPAWLPACLPRARFIAPPLSPSCAVPTRGALAPTPGAAGRGAPTLLVALRTRRRAAPVQVCLQPVPPRAARRGRLWRRAVRPPVPTQRRACPP